MQQVAGRSILCVEGNAASRDCLKDILQEYECVFACNAYEAIRNLHSRPFDAYLLDYWMPDWSGPLLCREIRKYDPNSPVIFCTESLNETYKRRALRAGANAYLPKPIDAKILRVKLRGLLKLVDIESVRAKTEAERALREELERRAAFAAAKDAAARSVTGLGSATRTVERTARARAYKTFIDSGGTRAQFERWWAQVSHHMLAKPEFA